MRVAKKKSEPSLSFSLFKSLGYDPIPLVPQEKRPRDEGWTTLEYNTTQLDEELRDATRRNVIPFGIGLRCGTLRGLDIDVTDGDVMRRLETIVRKRKWLGSVVARQGQPPKLLFPFRSVDGPKRTVTLRKETSQQRIEVLGRGQQFVVSGVHPVTHTPYVLMNAKHAPVHVLPPFKELPYLDEDQITELLSELVTELERHGYATTRAPSTPGKTNAGTPSTPGVFPGPRWNAENEGAAADALMKITPDCGREDWLAIAMAIHAGTHGDDEGFDLFHTWSSGGFHNVRPQKYKGEAACRKTWASIKPGGGVGTGTLFALSKRYAQIESGAFARETHESNDVPKANGIDERRHADPLEENVSDDSDNDLLGFPAPLDFDAMLDRPIQRAPICGSWIPSHAVVLNSGHGGDGKSYVALEICVRLALGISVLGSVGPQVRCLYYSCEDELRVLQYRVWMICQKLGRKPSELDGFLTVFDMSAVVDTVLFANGGFTDRAVGLEAECLRRGARLVVVDNVSDVYDDEENNRAKVRAFVRGMTRMAQRINGAVMLLAHIDKAAARNKLTKDTYSGSTAWNNSVRCRWAWLTLPGADGSEQKVLELAKTNYGKPGDRFEVQWDDATSTFDLTAIQNMSADERAGEILADMLRAEELGMALSVSVTAPAQTNALKVLRQIRPEGYVGVKASTLAETLMRLEVGRYVTRKMVERSNRSGAFEAWVLTEAGRCSHSENRVGA